MLFFSIIRNSFFDVDSHITHDVIRPPSTVSIYEVWFCRFWQMRNRSSDGISTKSAEFESRHGRNPHICAVCPVPAEIRNHPVPFAPAIGQTSMNIIVLEYLCRTQFKNIHKLPVDVFRINITELAQLFTSIKRLCALFRQNKNDWTIFIQSWKMVFWPKNYNACPLIFKQYKLCKKSMETLG